MCLINANHENKNKSKIRILTYPGVLPSFNTVPENLSITMSRRYKN